MERLGLILHLEQTPVWLAAAVGPDDLMPSTGEGEDWSIGDLAVHVIASDDIIAPRVMQALVRPGVVFAGFDDRRWANISLRSGATLEERLQLFSLKRKQMVRLLRTLSDREWETTGTHDFEGEMSLAQIVKKLLDHEAEHRIQALAMQNENL